MNNSKEGVEELKEISRIFLKRKWWFAGSFLMVLVAGILLTFLSVPQYKSTSVIEVTRTYYNDLIYRYFPAESEALRIYPVIMQADELEFKKLEDINSNLRSDEIISETISKSGLQVSKESVASSIKVNIDGVNINMIIDVIYDNPEIAYKINKNLVSAIIEVNNKDNGKNYDDLLLKVENQINNLTGSSGSILEDLDKIKYNLTVNEGLFKSQIKILKEADLPAEPFNLNYKRNILISFFIAIGIGLIVTYLPSLFLSFKK
jgi:uncharacterized protein involved in exopolysaccharide biosynthesis